MIPLKIMSVPGKYPKIIRKLETYKLYLDEPFENHQPFGLRSAVSSSASSITMVTISQPQDPRPHRQPNSLCPRYIYPREFYERPHCAPTTQTREPLQSQISHGYTMLLFGYSLLLLFFTAVTMSLTAIPSAHAGSDILTVLATGVGSSVEGASRNAAENALTQVVGTFIDTEKQIEKRTEIRDGVQSLTKSIDTRMSEFSQGSIASFRTLEVMQEDGLTRVEAEVGVRISEFRAYVKQLSSDEVVFSANVFAQVAAAERNATSAHDILLQKVLMPVLSGEVSELRMGEPQVYAQLDPKFQDLLNINPSRLSPTTIIIPIEIRLQQGFIEMALDAFENIAADREYIHFDRDFCQSRMPYSPGAITVGVHSFKGAPVHYLFNDVLTQRDRDHHTKMRDEDEFSLRKRESWRLGFFRGSFEHFVSRKRNKLPNLRVQFKGADGQVLMLNPSQHELFFVADPRIKYRASLYSNYIHLNIGSAYDLGCSGLQSGVALFPERMLYIVMNLAAADLEVIKSVEVSYTTP